MWPCALTCTHVCALMHALMRPATRRLCGVAGALLAALLQHLRKAHAALVALAAGARAALLQQEVRDGQHDGEPSHHQQHHKREVDAGAGVGRLVAVVDVLILCLDLSVCEGGPAALRVGRDLALLVRSAIRACDRDLDWRVLVGDAAAAQVTAKVPARHPQRRRRVLHLAAIHEDLGLAGLGATRHVPVAKRARVPQHAILTCWTLLALVHWLAIVA
mmetsp:Transcript_32309/g.69835  ORF Transcript_32309/g.69835 Transcript_32309/m.69835 type:complete len:218 (-) Transcript_32309:477-1130(-)